MTACEYERALRSLTVQSYPLNMSGYHEKIVPVQ